MLEKIIKLLSEKKDGSGKCFKCGKPGHFARDCKASSSRLNSSARPKHKAEEEERISRIKVSASETGRSLAPAIECSIISIFQVGRKERNVIVGGYVDGHKRVLTVDT